MNKPLRILMVEDSEDDATLLLRTLHSEGYEVVYEVVDTPSAMRAALERKDWDVITSDHAMPQFSAPKALALAKELRPSLPFIILSGEIDLNLAVSLMKGGAQDYIQKRELPRIVPAIERELKEAESIIKRKQAEQALRIQNKTFSQVLDSLDALVYVVDMKTYEIVFINAYGQNIWGDVKGKICWQEIQSGQTGPCEFCTNSKLIGPDGKPTDGVVWEFQNTVNKRWYDCRDRAVYWPDGRIVRMEIATDITERKQADKKLQDSEIRFHQLADSTWEGIMIHREGIILDVNEAILKMFGWHAEDVIGKSALEFLAPESIEAALQKLAEGIYTPQIYLEAMGLRKDKTIFPIEVLGRPFKHNNIDARVLAIRDITARKQAEQKLRESEEKYRNLVENVSDVIYEIDSKGVVVYISPVVRDIMEYDQADIVGKNFIDFVYEDDRSLLIGRFFELSEGIEYPFDYRLISKSGDIRWVRTKTTPIMENGSFVGARGTLIDISDRKQAEEVLKDTTQYLSNLINYANAPIIVWDRDFVITRFNGAFERLTGLSSGNVINRKLNILFPDARAHEIMNYIRETTQRGEQWETVEIPVNNVDGSVKIVLWNSANIYSSDGKEIVSTIAQGHDITERKRAEDELILANIKLESLWNVASLSDADTKTVSDHILESITRMTQSEYGFYGFINDDESVMTIHSWSGGAMKDCSLVDKPQHFAIGKAGVWAEAVRSRKPLILNDYRVAHGGKKGLPAGHVELTNLMVVPFFTHDRITAVAAVANRLTAYSRNDVNQITAFLNSVKVIVDSKRAEEAVRDSQQRLTDIIEFLPDATLAIDNDKRIIIWNRAIEAMTGIPAKEMIGKGDYVYTIPFYGEARPQLMDLVLSDNEEIAARYPMIRREGSMLEAEAFCNALYNNKGAWVYAKASPLRDQNGSITGVIEIIRDVTDRRRGEENLRSQQAELEMQNEELHRTHRELEISREKYFDLYDLAPVGYLTINERGLILEVNLAAATLLGSAKGDLVKQLLTHFILPEDQDIYYRLRKRLFESESPQACEIRMRRMNAPSFCVRIEAIRAKDDEGNPVYRITISDITTLKQSEEALRESQAQLKEAHRLAHIGVWQWDMETDTITWTEEIYRIAGLDPMLPAPSFAELHNIFAPESMDILREAVEQATKRGEPYQLELKLIRSDGTPRWVNAFGGVTYNDQGRIHGLHGTLQDITDRKQAKEELRESEEKYRNIVDHMTDALSIIDPDGNILFANSLAAMNLSGGNPNDLIGKNIRDFVPPSQAEQLIANYRRVVVTETPFDGEIKVTLRGIDRWFRNRLIPYKHGASQLPAVLSISLNITERKILEKNKSELEERLNRAGKMEALGVLAGGVAHDLNNALGILVGYAELLYDGLDESDPLRDDARNILMGGERAAAIIQDLLTLARRGVQTKTVVNLNKTVVEYLKSPEHLKLSAFHPTVRIETDLDEELMNVVGSPVHLFKTLMNLVSNAAESMPSGGDVVIKTESRYLDRPVSGYDKIEEGNYIVLSVADTGDGITDDDMKRIFEPFYTKKVMGRSGTGLGLSVVWGTVKDHNGYIDVQSRRGKGTSFVLYFPMTHEEVGEDRVAHPDEYMGHGEKILVVDDIDFQRDLASRILKKLDYAVEVVSSGEEAVAYLKKTPVDLVILDMIMDPGIDGFETYRQIWEIRPGQKAIIVSGFAETERVKMAQSLGAGAFVKKPYIRERLGLAVRKELDRK